MRGKQEGRAYEGHETSKGDLSSTNKSHKRSAGWLVGRSEGSSPHLPLLPFLRYIARSCPFCVHLPVCSAFSRRWFPPLDLWCIVLIPTLASSTGTLPLSDCPAARYRKVDRAPCSVSDRPAYPITYRPRARPCFGMSPPLVTLLHNGETSGRCCAGSSLANEAL